MQPSPPMRLPELRQELRLERGATGAGGEPTWLVVDPMAGRYIQIDATTHVLLTLWTPGGSAAELAKIASGRTGLEIEPAEVEELARFLDQQRLTIEPLRDGWNSYAADARRRDHGWLAWAVHNYLFVKIPLVRPQRFIDRTLPLVAFAFGRAFWVAIAATGFAGLYLVSRQWEAFTATFVSFLSWDGAVTFAITLAVVKSLHELGHAYTAARFGCRVPSMGICFMVLAPMLYTDVTDAWRLTSRRQRLAIDAAGMAVELALACLATMAWVFLPDGPLRAAAFSVATVGWIMSVAVNLNPLMRFDGYYILSDLIGVDNLQARAFALGRWRLREALLGLGATPPEPLARGLRRLLVVYAWTVWVYRLVLFTGIALMVYHMTFKVLGVVLFLIEIVYFIARPIWSEAAAWWSERRRIRVAPRAWISAGAVAALAVAAVVPWSTRIRVPAVVEAAELSRVFPPRPGHVEQILVAAGQRVTAGEPIARISSAELAHELALARRRIALIEMRLARRGADDADRERSLTLERELQAERSRRAGLEREAAELVLRAPHDGIVVELNRELHPGRAVSRSEHMATIAGEGGLIVRGYVAGEDLARVSADGRGLFAPDDATRPRLPVALADVATSASRSIEIAELASVHGGPVAVRPQMETGGQRRLAPIAATYLTRFAVDPGEPRPEKAERGVVLLEGAAESLAERALRQVLKVLVRESGV